MSSRRACLLLLAGGVLLLGLGILSLAAAQYLYVRRAQLRLEYLPPQVQIIPPPRGNAARAGSYLPITVLASAAPPHPLRRVEIWHNGTLLESFAVAQPDPAAPLFIPYDFLLPAEGVHTLLARAENDQGLIGQSQPLVVVGTPADEAAYHAVTVEEESALEDIAAQYESDADTLNALNPAAGETVAPGSVLLVPAAPHAAPAAAPPAATPSAPMVALPAAGNALQPAGSLLKPLLTLLAARPPQPPANLLAEAKNCQIILQWEDLADNESGYEVWMTAANTPQTLLAVLQAASGGVVRYEFAAPAPGKLTFWVRAVNAVGAQPSNLTAVEAAAQCPSSSTGYLEVDIVSLNAGGAAERVYCYISLEEAAEVRLPAADGNFVAVSNGQGNLQPWQHTFAVPLPQDGALDMGGECWGWAGAALSKLGDFSAHLDSQTWDGTPRALQSGGVGLQVSLRPQTAASGKTIFAERSPSLPSSSPSAFLEESGPPIDPSLAVPYDVNEVALSSVNDPWVNVGDPDPRQRYITWKWDGDQKSIARFDLYLNGVVVASTWPENRASVHRLHYGCGMPVRWQVAAASKTASSALSKPFEYDTPPCQHYVRVRFLEVQLYCTAEGSSSCYEKIYSDTLDAYYTLTVNGQTRAFWGGNVFLPLSTGVKFFSDLGSWYAQNNIYPSADTFVLPFEGEAVDVQVAVRMWDHDSTSADDVIFSYARNDWFPNLQKALDDLRITSPPCLAEMASGLQRTGTAVAEARYTIEVFPNTCRDAP